MAAVIATLGSASSAAVPSVEVLDPYPFGRGVAAMPGPENHRRRSTSPRTRVDAPGPSRMVKIRLVC